MSRLVSLVTVSSAIKGASVGVNLRSELEIAIAPAASRAKCGRSLLDMKLPKTYNSHQLHAHAGRLDRVQESFQQSDL